MALCDTGSQIYIMSQNYFTKDFPEIYVQGLDKLLELGSKIELRAANNTPVPYSGFVELDFRLLNSDNFDVLTVPCLVSDSTIEDPIIGYSGIEESLKVQQTTSNFIQSFQETFQHRERECFKAPITAILDEEDEELSTLKSPKSNLFIQPQQFLNIYCCGKAEIGKIQTPVNIYTNRNVPLAARFRNQRYISHVAQWKIFSNQDSGS